MGVVNYCDKCGGPLRDCNDPDRRDLDQGEECRLCVLEWWAEDNRPLWVWSGTVEAANSTANTPATSMWLPHDARLPFFDPMTPEQERRSDEALLDAWMMYHGVGSGWIHEFWGTENRTGQV